MTALALETYSDSQIAELYNTADDETYQASLLAEMQRRDDASRWRPDADAEWLGEAHAQYLDAERECRGNLVREGSRVKDAWRLWTGPEWMARQSATEELRNYWDAHGRTPVRSEYRDQARLEEEAYRDEYTLVAEPEPVQDGGRMDELLTYDHPDREPLDTEWTWEGRLPRGKVVVIAGWRQSAKGLLTCDLAARVTTGEPFPGEETGREPGDVVMVTAEDDANEDMAWRLRAAGADLSRVHDLTYLPDGSPFELSASRTSPGNTADLLAYIRKLRECGRNPRMVVLDPLNALVMDGTIKTDQGARRVIGRLQFVASRTGVTILVIHHFVKDGGIGGSQGLEDAPRWIYTIQPDRDAPEYKVFHLHKCNVAVAEDLRYRIISDGHDSRIEWADRAAIQREERAWRDHDLEAVKSLQATGEAERRQVMAWLKTGGGSIADGAKWTGFSEAVVERELAALEAAGTVKAARRLRA